MSENKLPALVDLYANKELARKNTDLLKILNAKPNSDWIKDHPIAKDVKYIPIEIIEYLLTAIFLKYRVEIKKTEIVANSIMITVRLYVLDPITNEWDYQDGIGASPIQTAKGEAATDFTKVGTYSVQKSAPAAESFAIKDAAEKFGKIFGKDLNRKNSMNYGATTNMFDENDIKPID